MRKDENRARVGDRIAISIGAYDLEFETLEEGIRILRPEKDKMIIENIRNLPDNKLANMFRALPDEEITNIVIRQIDAPRDPEHPINVMTIKPKGMVRKAGTKRLRASSGDVAKLQAKVVAALKGSGAAVSTVAKKTGLEPTQAQRVLKGLVAAKKVFMAGERRFARYGLSPKAAKDASERDRKGE